MKTWNILFKKSLKSFLKPAALITTLSLILLMVLLITVIIPKVTGWTNNPWNSLIYTLAFSSGFELALYIGMLCALCHLTFDVNEATFFLTRPVKRSTFVSSKLTAQIIVFTFLAFIVFGSWLIANKIYFPNMDEHMYPTDIVYSLWTGNGKTSPNADWTFTMAACIVPYLLANFAAITINATFKWFNKNWIVPTALTVITFLAIIPYVFLGMFQHKGVAVFKTYCYNSTLVIPSIMFGVISFAGIIANIFTTKYRNVRV